MSKQDQILAVFKQFDANGDGTISEDEMKSTLLKIGMTEDEIKVCLEQADANKDGVVDYDEFIAWVYGDTGAVVLDEAIKKLGAGARGIKSQATCDALEAAASEISKIKKKDITEIKSLGKPPQGVLMCLAAVATLMGVKKPDEWINIQKMIADSAFLQKLIDFDKDSVKGGALTEVKKYTDNEAFTPDAMAKSSKACKGICQWVLAIIAYAEE